MNYKVILKISLIFLLGIVSINTTLAQYNSEEELKKAADKFFDEENFIEALPLFSQLLSTYPKDLNYNYKYGACYLFATRDKEKALNYLTFAASRPNVDPLAYYYLARAYHHNYEFASAIVYYNKYKGKTSTKDHQKYQIERRVEMCKNGQQLLKKINKIGVISKKEIKESEFFRSYDLRGLQGKVIVKPDEFKQKMDKKLNEYSILYSDPNLNVVVFSSYGDKGDNKDIYKIEKIGINQFSDPISLGNVINTPYDEDYAFLHPDGKTLYFSSKGHNSMGGYDIFKSTYDNASGTWSTPVNLDFPINTPDDDILYISDIDNQLAYFASSRASKQKELTVYKVKVEPQPMHNPIIKGLFVSEEDPNMKNATISIVDAMDNTKYGVYTTDGKSGEYLLTFPADAKKYKIIIETTNNAPIHSAIIELPKMNEFKLLKQELLLVGSGDNEKLVVKNLFDQTDEFDITNPIIVENLLKQQAKLDVNITEEEALSSITDNNTTLTKVNNNSDYSDLSDEEILAKTNTKIASLLDKTNDSELQQNYYFDYAAKKATEAKNNYNQDTKNKDDVAINVNEASLAMKLGRVTQNESVERNSDKNKLIEYQEQINKAIDEGNRAKAEEILAAVEKIEEASYFKNDAVSVEEKLTQEKLKTAQENYRKQRDIVTSYTNRKLELEKSVTDLENKIASTKKTKEKEELEAQLATYKIDLEDIDFQLEKSKNKESIAQEELNKAKNDVNLIAQIIEKEKNQSQPLSTPNNQIILATESNIQFFEQEGVLGYYPSTTSSSSSSTIKSTIDLVALKDDYEIIDDNGELIDYNSNYKKEAEKNKNNPEAIVSINEKWIAAIEEDIEIKNKQKSTATSLNDKANYEQVINQLSTLKAQKEEEIELQNSLIAQESNNNNTTTTSNNNNNTTTTSNNNNNTTTSSTNNNITTNTATSKKYNTSIIDKDGNIIDYNSEFLAELESLPEDEQTAKLFAQKAEIYDRWADATEQEITLKKVDLVEADESEKAAIQEDIDELTTELQDKEEFAALFITQAKALATTDEELAYIDQIETQINTEYQETAIVADNASNETANSTSNKTIPTSNFNNIVIDDNGNVADYSSSYQNQLATIDKNNSTPIEKTENKIDVTTQWIETIDEEIDYQNQRLATIDDEEEQQIISQKISVLNENKTIQVEQLSNLQSDLLAEKNNSIETNSSSTTSNNTSNTSTENIDNNEITSTSRITPEATIDEEINYQSNTANELIPTLTALSEDLNELKSKATNAQIAANESDDEATKEEYLQEATNFNNQANDKIIEIANVFERANASEYQGNQNKVNALMKAASGKSSENNFMMAEMMNDEAVELFNEAIVARQNAVNEADINTKQALLAEAKNKENEALKKQQNAIGLLEQLAPDTSTTLATNETNSTNKNESSTNNANANNNKENPTVNNNTNTNLAANTNTNNTNTVEVYEPKKMEFPSNEKKKEALELEKEAISLNQQANELDKKAAETKNRKEKEAIVVEANQKREEADIKAKEAEVIYSEVAELEKQEQVLVEELYKQRKELIAEVLTIEEEQQIASLTVDEINVIKSTPEFNEYQTLKESSRRLVKEAQVEYIAADKAADEANDQKQLGNALKAMQAAATSEEDKNKLANQMKQLEAMIAENESTSKELRNKALEKEKEALEKNKNANNIANSQDGNNGLAFAAIEKTNKDDDAMLTDYQEQVINELPENKRKKEAANNDKNNETTPTNTNEDTTNELATNENTTESNETNNNENVTENNLMDDNTSNNNNGSNNLVEDTSSNTSNTSDNDVLDDENNFVDNNNSINETNNNESATDKQTTSENINIDEIPEQLTTSIFTITSPNKSAYNENKRIPKNPKLPEGLVFKVQIGAFRNPIPQDHYKGFAPLMAEDAGNGITRYTAGLFKTFNVANMAKNEIRTMGYPDAFVVAFFNGKRININEARAMLNETELTDEISFNTTNNKQNTTNNNTSSNEANTVEDITTEEVKDGISKDVRNIEGVFFTIQVGVYSKPITPNQLNNLTPLNSERTANGLIRYTSGVYKNISDANAGKERAINFGIADAFIIAYSNGRKITIAEANQLLGENNNTSTPTNTSSEITPNNNSTNETDIENNNNFEDETDNSSEETITLNNNTSTTNNESATNNNTSVNETTNNTENTTTNETNTTKTPRTDEELQQIAEELNIVFKVKIGEYTEDISNEDAAIFLKLADRNIENFEDGEKTIYTVGSLLDYKSALNLQLEMKEEGVKSPQVIAFKNNEIIALEEALELIKEQ